MLNILLMRIHRTSVSVIFIIAIYFSIPLSQSFAQGNMRPLAEIIEETKSGPETKESIFHLFSLLGVRCGGFYGAMAGLVKNKQLALLSTNMAQVTAISEQLGAKTEVEKALTEAMDQVLKTKDIYRAIMIENNTRNGNYFKGHPLLDSDYLACKEATPALLGFVKKAGVDLIR